jgi:hypothetical protein
MRAASIVLSLGLLQCRSGSAAAPLPIDRFAICRENADSYLATMKMLEASVRANFERLSTWSGSFELREGSRQQSIQSLPLEEAGAGVDPVNLTGDL